MIYAQCIFKEHFSANIVKDISLVKTGGLMYLVRTKQGDKFVESADDVKHINKNDVLEVFMLEKLDYDSIASTSEIRDCLYNYLKDDQIDRDTVLDYVAATLDVPKSKVSKVINSIIKEKIIYVVEDDGWLGIN